MKSLCSTKQWKKINAVTALALGMSAALPALAVEDTDTIGDKHWEINVAVEGEHGKAGWDVVAPNIEVNYGIGERTQLQAVVPWVARSHSSNGTDNGFGAASLGVKYRFLDQETAGFSLSAFPVLQQGMLPSSIRRGLAPAKRQWSLPVEIGYEHNDIAYTVELGRNLNEGGPDEDFLGARASFHCTKTISCRVEAQKVFSPDGQKTVADIMAKFALTENVFLKATVGRELLNEGGERKDLLLKLELQVNI